MIAVIIAGGSGTRLWPLSTPEYPKHLLKINGDADSLLQRTYTRAKSIANSVYIITEAGHAHHVKEQLPELSDDAFIIEPARRGTASCIIASLAHIGERHDENEPIAILSADHFIRDVEGFRHSFQVAGNTSQRDSRVVLVGVEPDYPATGFGYIQKDKVHDVNTLVYNVHSFKEKPDYNTALAYMKTGDYLWNCGYFVGSVATFKKKMEEKAPKLAENFRLYSEAKPEDKDKVYLDFENDTIDYALIEKLDDLLVVPASFDWMDLGSYGDLQKAAGSDQKGNYTHGEVELEAVENSYVHNEDEKPVAVIGLDNVAVVNTPAGILVTRKDLAQKVGEVSKRIAKKNKES